MDEKEIQASTRDLHIESISNDSQDEVAEEAKGGDLSDMPEGYYRSWRFIGSVAAVAFMAQGLYLGYILPANTITLINADIGPDPNYALIPIVKSLCGGVGLLLVGRLSDIFGRRWFMIAGAVMGIVGSIICGTAKNIDTILGGTVLIGLAGAIQTSFSFVLMELVANKHRAVLTGLLFLSTCPLAAFGPLIARCLASYTALMWRWNYILNCISNSISGILFFICYYPPTHGQLHEGRTMKQDLRDLDWGGIILFSGGLTSFVLGLSWGGGLHPWASYHVLVPLIIGFFILVGFAFYEVYMDLKYPLVPMSLFLNGRFMALVGVASVASMFYYSLTVIWPQMITSLYESNQIMIGLMSGVLGGSIAFGQVLGGGTIRLGFGHWQLRLSALAMCGFIGAMAATDASTRTLAIVMCCLGALAVGVVEVVGIVAVPFTVPPADLGLASGLLGSCRATLGSVATAIFSSILTTTKAKEIPPRLIRLAEQDNLPQSSIRALVKAGLQGAVASFAKIPGVSADMVADYVVAVRDGNVKAYHMVFYSSLAFGGLAVICAFCTKEFNSHFTNKVERRLQHMEKKKAAKEV
ncbi:fungal trichothecene efflux pump [Lindgomyces ingoldianus]|uniref:Fungal trichothecene efflux pump n=1 Tax=Lindgomyces ingoldianus TaxID=673940 RepID=A0ACB6R950_9PLEO|nr:fungal trichothecene efflux pump [Lindgomyces ingoldianus]KAF2474847.1 fungal trichothecene efflux pump [Lindgomyces ingoldianus]